MYRVIAVAPELCDAVRRTLRSPQYGHPAHVEVAAGYGPCRSCLSTFREGEERRILFTYEPFQGRGELSAPGPVFIHQDVCDRFEGAGLPPSFERLSLALEAFGHDGRLLTRDRPAAGELEGALRRLLDLPATDYVHIRNAEAGCFVARVEREAA